VILKNLTKKALIGALVTLGLHPLASHSQEEKAFMSSCKQNLQTYAKGMEQNAKVTGYIGMGAHSVSFLSKLCLFFVPQREKEKHNKLTIVNS
jgi:peptide deformylase